MIEITAGKAYTDATNKVYKVLNIGEMPLIGEKYVVYKQEISANTFLEPLVKFQRRMRKSLNDLPVDNVSHPAHYCYGKYEPKDVIRDWGLNFNKGNALKYIARAGKKNDEIEDLQKAIQYLEFEIEYLEKEHDGNAST